MNPPVQHAKHRQRSRRQILRGSLSSLALVGVHLTGTRYSLAASKAFSPTIDVLETKTISHTPEHYHGWPTLARAPDGKLWVAYSGGREAHVCPFGRVEIMQSADNGESWTWPRTIYDGPLDDRDAGVMCARNGSIFVTTFTSLAYYDYYFKKELAERKAGTSKWSTEKFERWHAVHSRLTDEQRTQQLGQWILRSDDGGISWTKPYASVVNSPHGPIELNDGRLLYAGKELWTGSKRVGVAHSTDQGHSWEWLAEIPTRPGDKASDYHELHAAELPSGKLVAHIRNHNTESNRETLQSESSDGGRSWSVPRSIGVWGLPSFLTPISDGRLLMTYGYRRKPFGNQIRISADEGATWSQPLHLSDDGNGGDLGYPSTVQIASDRFVSVWYELLKGSSRAVLRQAVWQLKG